MQPEVPGVEGREQEAALCAQHVTLAAGRTEQTERPQTIRQLRKPETWVQIRHLEGAVPTQVPSSANLPGEAEGTTCRFQQALGRAHPLPVPSPLDLAVAEQNRLVKKANRGMNIPTAGLGLRETGTAGPGDKTRTKRVKGEETTWWG